MTHVLLTHCKATNGNSFTSYEDLKQCLKALLKAFESDLQKQNPNALVISYDLDELFSFFDKIASIACFAQIFGSKYELHDKEWIKDQFKLWLKPFALKRNGKLTFRCVPLHELPQDGQFYDEDLRLRDEWPLQSRICKYMSQRTDESLSCSSSSDSTEQSVVAVNDKAGVVASRQEKTLAYINDILKTIMDLVPKIERFNVDCNDSQYTHLYELLATNFILLDEVEAYGDKMIQQKLMCIKMFICNCRAFLQTKAIANTKISNAIEAFKK